MSNRIWISAAQILLVTLALGFNSFAVDVGATKKKEDHPAPRVKVKRLLPSTKGLVLYYNCDEQDGILIQDRSPNHNHATFTNEVTWIADGPVGGGIQLKEKFISSAKKLGVADASPRTLAFFINVHSVTQADRCNRWIGWGPGDSKATSFVAASWGLNRMVWSWGWKMDWTVGGKVALDKWHHVAITVDEEMRSAYYLDGRKIQERPPFGYLTVDTPLYIGWSNTNAMFDEIVIYDRALSEREVLRMHEFLLKKAKK